MATVLSPRRSIVSATLLTVLLISLPGCLVASDTRQTHSGTNVPESTFSQIEPGKTTVAWVQATLGEPSQKTRADDDEIWKYSYSEHTDSSGAVFLIFGGHSSTESSHKWFVEFKDGVVVKKWRA